MEHYETYPKVRNSNNTDIIWIIFNEDGEIISFLSLEMQFLYSGTWKTNFMNDEVCLYT
jgi:hypothetical protein